jgi:Cu+-exporting ATPase
MTIDPVCGMEVEEKTAPASAEYDGEMYSFCSEKCREEFMQDPGQFIGLAA